MGPGAFVGADWTLINVRLSTPCVFSSLSVATRQAYVSRTKKGERFCLSRNDFFLITAVALKCLRIPNCLDRRPFCPATTSLSHRSRPRPATDVKMHLYRRSFVMTPRPRGLPRVLGNAVRRCRRRRTAIPFYARLQYVPPADRGRLEFHIAFV